jgi:hypothetical protein
MDAVYVIYEPILDSQAGYAGSIPVSRSIRFKNLVANRSVSALP